MKYLFILNGNFKRTLISMNNVRVTSNQRIYLREKIIEILTYCSITGPISMGQCEALNAKHSVQTCFKIVFCCCDGNCWKYSLSLACLTHAIKICANTLKFNVWFAASNVSGIIVREIIFDAFMDCCCCCCWCCCFTSSRIFDWIIGFCFRGPRSSCTAFFLMGNFPFKIFYKYSIFECI